MQQIQTLQQEYLAQLIKRQQPTILYFKNGHRITGTITGITNEAIFFRHGITEYFYKNHIHSIIPITKYTTKI